MRPSLNTERSAEGESSQIADSGAPPRIAARWVALAAVVSGCLSLAAVRLTRPPVGTDAIAYMAVGHSILDGNGIGFWLEHPLTTWPPLWPILLAGGMKLTGWRGDLVGLGLNLLLAAGCVALGVAVGRRVLDSSRLLVVLTASLAVSPFLIGLTIIVQTEVAFSAICLLVILAILKSHESSNDGGFNLRWLVGAGLMTAVGFYIRYQALYVVPIFGLWLIIRELIRRRPIIAALVPAAAYALPAVLPSAVWMIRNMTVSDTAMGPRFPSSVGPIENLAGALRTAFKFLTSIPSAPLLPAAALTGIVGLVAVVILVRVTKGDAGEEAPLAARCAAAWCGPSGLLVVFVAGFTLLMVVSRSVVGFDDLDVRLLSPCFVPTSLLFLRYVEVVLLPQTRSVKLRPVGVTLVGVWLAAQVLVTFALIGPANHLTSDFGYNAKRARAASTSPALESIPEGCIPYSNNAADLYRSGFEAQQSPRTVEYKSSQRTHQLQDLVRRVDQGEQACLVWVGYTDDVENYSPTQMREVLDLKKLASADEVTVYKILPKSRA